MGLRAVTGLRVYVWKHVYLPLHANREDIEQQKTLECVWKHSPPLKLAPLHKNIPKHLYQLHSTPSKTDSTPLFFGAPQEVLHHFLKLVELSEIIHHCY